MGETLMEKVRTIVRKYQEQLIIMIQVVLCVIFAGKVIDKEIKQKLKISERAAKQEAKRSEKMKKALLKNARKLAKTEYHFKLLKLKRKVKLEKIAAKTAIKKYKEKQRKNKKRK